jgi:hypothetical protein
MSKKLSQLFLEEYKKILNEQDPMSQYGGVYQPEPLPSDYLGPGRGFEQNYTPTINQARIEQQKKDSREKESEKTTSLYDIFKKWDEQEQNDEKLIEGGWQEVLDEYGNPLEDIDDPYQIEVAKKAFSIYQDRQNEEKNSTLTDLKDQMLSTLPKFTYVELGTNKQYDEAPKNWNTKLYGGFYEKTPPSYLFDPVSETTVLLAPSSEEQTDDPNFNSEYKKYRSPKDVEKNFYDFNKDKDLKKFGIVQSNKEELLNNEILLQIFKPEQITYALTQCAGGEAEAFLREIVRGTIKNKNGRVVGRKYPGMDDIERYDPLSGSVDDKDGGIPCQSLAYYQYGIVSQILVGVLTMALIPVGGWVAFGALLTEALVNAWAIKEDMDRQDSDAVKLDVAFLFIPFLLEASAFKRTIQYIQMPNADNVYKGLLQKIRNVPKTNGKYDAVALNNLMQSLTSDEKNFLKYVKDTNNTELRAFLKEAGKEAEKRIMQYASKNTLKPLSAFRKNLKGIMTMVTIGVPTGIYFAKVFIDAAEKGLQRPLSEDEKQFISVLSTFYKEDQEKKLQEATKEQFEKLMKLAAEYNNLKKQAENQNENPEGYTEQDIKEINDFAPKFREMVKIALETVHIEPCKDSNGQTAPCPEKEKQVNEGNE